MREFEMELAEVDDDAPIYVCVQDEPTGYSPLTVAIADSTWQGWFETWLAQLDARSPQDMPYLVDQVDQAGQLPPLELSLRLTGDREIHQLNSEFRQVDRPTDVLAFAALEWEAPEVDFADLEEVDDAELGDWAIELGDVVISVETAQRQATEAGHDLTTELAWLAAHGFLHLLGWDHPTEPELNQMLDRQTALLQAVGLTPQVDLAKLLAG
ncbi:MULTISPECIES: rRNA maturation RNase YbeY [unclassified Limnothrix]|uniref:rRNA maturation RNase YbeY n=1 Tax=unclassified Limnothrix TaxID=2632864 RepID=UPI001F550B10|nr:MULTISPECIES: rRNA maturation RNase YbeY [unclassified Limnothrix]